MNNNDPDFHGETSFKDDYGLRGMYRNIIKNAGENSLGFQIRDLDICDLGVSDEICQRSGSGSSSAAASNFSPASVTTNPVYPIMESPFTNYGYRPLLDVPDFVVPHEYLHGITKRSSADQRPKLHKPEFKKMATDLVSKSFIFGFEKSLFTCLVC